MSSESRQQLFRQILGAASLPPQHTAMLDLLLQLDAEGADEPTATAPAPKEAGERSRSNELFAEMEAELSDLREMNDTLAAALGACRICWGGDDGCDVCRGHGRAGWTTPEPTLFQELVVPAVVRARTPPRRQRRAEAAPRRRTAELHDHDDERQDKRRMTEDA